MYFSSSLPDTAAKNVPLIMSVACFGMLRGMQSSFRCLQQLFACYYNEMDSRSTVSVGVKQRRVAHQINWEQVAEAVIKSYNLTRL